MIPRKLKIEERREIAACFANHRVYQTISLCCKPFEAQFPTLQLKVEDIFQIVCSLLDDVMNDARAFYNLRTLNLMEEIKNDLKDWQSNIPDDELLLATGVILEMFAAYLLIPTDFLYHQISNSSLGAISNRYPDFIIKVENPISRKLFDLKLRTGSYGICDYASQGMVYDEIQRILKQLDKTIPPSIELPEELRSMKAMKAWSIAQTNGWVNEEYQPTLKTKYEIGLLADAMARFIGIKQKWIVFGNFWHITNTALRSAYNKANELREYLMLWEKLKEELPDK